MDTRTIFFIGKPGCGKGTQAKLLSEKTGWTVFASGKLFRELAQEDTPVGHKVKSENDAGNLQPHWFAMYLYLKALFTLPTEGLSVIFDGFNRKVPEAELVIDSLKWLGRPFTILDIQVSDEEVRRRLALRKGIEGRADDSAVDERLEVGVKAGCLRARQRRRSFSERLLGVPEHGHDDVASLAAS